MKGKSGKTCLNLGPVFMTGTQGLIGWNLYTTLRAAVPVTALSRQPAPSDEGEWYEGLLEEFEALKETLIKSKAVWVIHAQAMCNLDLCELKPEKTWLVNVTATERLLEALDPGTHRLVYISTEHVFSGRNGPYREEDTPDPVSVYGKSRAAAERRVLDRYPGTLVIRPGLAIGPSLQGNIGPHDWLKSRILAGRPASYFVDEVRSPVAMDDLMRGILRLILAGAEGIYHLGGPERLSRFEIAARLAPRWGSDADVRAKRIHEDTIPRIADCSLVSEKAAAEFGWNPGAFDRGAEE